MERICGGVSGKLQNAAGFRCKVCVYEQLFRVVVALNKIIISSLEKLEVLACFVALFVFDFGLKLLRSCTKRILVKAAKLSIKIIALSDL